MKKLLLKFFGVMTIVGIFSSMAISFAIAATIPTSVALFETTLASSITASATSFTLVSATTKDGTTLSGNYAFIIDEGTATEEMVSASCTATACTSATRGLSVVTGNTTVTALRKDHRRGASVKITDGPQLLILSRINNGQETFPNAISYASGVGPISGSDIADKEYVLSVASGGTITYDKLIVTGTAATTIAAGNLVYLNGSGKWDLADADSASTTENIMLGIAQGAGTTNNLITNGVLIRGVDANQSGASAGATGYVSSTAGAIATTAPTAPAKTKVIGTFQSATAIYFDPNFFYGLTTDMKAALVGSLGTPSTTNKFVTQDNLSTNGSDQSQTTQNGSIETGEANATTKKNKIAQSFVATRNKLSAIKLYKSADTGIFTGTVKVAIQADTTGSPSGSDLASVTLTNAQWTGLSVGEFTATIGTTYGTEYWGLTAGTTYWIVITPSTSDNSNHPNIGTNTAGGYSSGSVKYNNTTDGWVAVSTIDLYFKTIEGVVSQAIQSDLSGKLPSQFYDVTKMPVPAFQQNIPIESGTTLTIAEGAGSNQDGSILFLFTNSGNELVRMARDANTGQYFVTHQTNTTGLGGHNKGVVVLGSYVYVFYDAGANAGCFRYDLANNANETAITFGSPIALPGSQESVNAWTDGRYIYFVHGNDNTTVYNESISGTTLTQVTTSSATAGVFGANQQSAFYDGTTIYSTNPNSTTHFDKFTAVNGSSVTSTNYNLPPWSAAVTDNTEVIVNIDSTRMYVGRLSRTYNASTQEAASLMLVPITKP